MAAATVKLIYFSKASAVGPSSRYRIYQYLPHLDRKGIQYRVRPLFGRTYFSLLELEPWLLRILAKGLYTPLRFLRRIVDLLLAGKSELMVIEGQLFTYGPAWVELWLVLLKKNIVIEFDDAIYLTFGHRRKMPRLLAMASAVIVGNENLAQYARQFSDTVIVVPTVVDTERFAPPSSVVRSSGAGKAERLTVVWIGLAYNLGYLDQVAPVLKELHERGLINFRVICSRPPVIPGLPVDFVPWSYEREVEDAREGDVGIMPLTDTEWDRGKCGLKLLQYMALGMATVSSPVGVNRDIVANGENGFLAATIDEWRKQLLRLCQDSALRQRMGVAARKTVEDKYSLRVWGPRLADLYARLAGNASPRSQVCATMQSVGR